MLKVADNIHPSNSGRRFFTFADIINEHATDLKVCVQRFSCCVRSRSHTVIPRRDVI